MRNNAKGKARLVWGSTPAGTVWGGNAQPGTEDFFQTILKKRFTYEIPWILELVPFASFNRAKVLELGCGAGYDAYQFCRNGSDYTGIDIAFENAERVKRNLGFFGYFPKVAEGDAENLPFKNSSFQVVFSNGVLHHIPDIEKCLGETHRVLGRYGEFYIIVYHKHSIFYWVTLFLFDHLLRLGFMRRRFKQRLSLIEYTTSNEVPLVNVYSRRSLRRMLENRGFVVESLWVRKLLKEDLPAIPFLAKLWQYIPQPWLDSFGKYFGWYLIARARKV